MLVIFLAQAEWYLTCGLSATEKAEHGEKGMLRKERWSGGEETTAAWRIQPSLLVSTCEHNWLLMAGGLLSTDCDWFSLTLTLLLAPAAG